MLSDLLAARAEEIVVRWTLAVLLALLASMMFGSAAGMAGMRWWLLDGTATVISNDLATRVAKGR
jgi:Na+/serine symporter